MQRCVAKHAHADGFAQLEVVDAKQFERLLNFGKHSALELDALCGHNVVGAEALEVIVEPDKNAYENCTENQVEICVAEGVRLVVRAGMDEVNGCGGYYDDDKKRQSLSDAVDRGGVAGKQLPFSLGLARGGVRRKVSVAEAAFKRHGLDGFTANRTCFCIFVHGSVLQMSAYQCKCGLTKAVGIELVNFSGHIFNQSIAVCFHGFFRDYSQRFYHAASVMAAAHSHFAAAADFKNPPFFFAQNLDEALNLAFDAGHLDHKRLRGKVDDARPENFSQVEDLSASSRGDGDLDERQLACNRRRLRNIVDVYDILKLVEAG